ncbi:hypothetical protein M0D69_26720 [Caballeronia sp. SEWSISQ10-4 2]|uniref:hypothetical protein n=1 Tax=Caballeronia sp. SEWSISQ10-4 2 TaxID=2937438 RepID=UPI00264D2B95|nr:hypothetical protein [Caballeronia sp. SEWSISQ10-4 2]MDN7181531.1 hypothetical protein [Caballeronia sp. SEWSISQ10-4 2]
MVEIIGNPNLLVRRPSDHKQENCPAAPIFKAVEGCWASGCTNLKAAQFHLYEKEFTYVCALEIGPDSYYLDNNLLKRWKILENSEPI